MFELQNERTELLEKIEELFGRKRYAELRDLLLPMEAADIASLCQDLDEKVPPAAQGAGGGGFRGAGQR